MARNTRSSTRPVATSSEPPAPPAPPAPTKGKGRGKGGGGKAKAKATTAQPAETDVVAGIEVPPPRGKNAKKGKTKVASSKAEDTPAPNDLPDEELPSDGEAPAKPKPKPKPKPKRKTKSKASVDDAPVALDPISGEVVEPSGDVVEPSGDVGKPGDVDSEPTPSARKRALSEMSDLTVQSSSSEDGPPVRKKTRKHAPPVKKEPPPARPSKRPADEQPEDAVVPKTRKTDADQSAGTSSSGRAKGDPKNRRAPPIDDEEEAEADVDSDADPDEQPEEEDEFDLAALAAARKAKKENAKLLVKVQAAMPEVIKTADVIRPGVKAPSRRVSKGGVPENLDAEVVPSSTDGESDAEGDDKAPPPRKSAPPPARKTVSQLPPAVRRSVPPAKQVATSRKGAAPVTQSHPAGRVKAQPALKIIVNDEDDDSQEVIVISDSDDDLKQASATKSAKAKGKQREVVKVKTEVEDVDMGDAGQLLQPTANQRSRSRSRSKSATPVETRRAREQGGDSDYSSVKEEESDDESHAALKAGIKKEYVRGSSTQADARQRRINERQAQENDNKVNHPDTQVTFNEHGGVGNLGQQPKILNEALSAAMKGLRRHLFLSKTGVAIPLKVKADVADDFDDSDAEGVEKVNTHELSGGLITAGAALKSVLKSNVKYKPILERCDAQPAYLKLLCVAVWHIL
ncbi:unnamed protein product [Peniophora sp. CBMAI 1063]|nr:unnamed protein product [Peniophora sp. CBMAI 1063]